MAHLYVPQNQALRVCRFVPDIQVCGTHGREVLASTIITPNTVEDGSPKFLLHSNSVGSELGPGLLEDWTAGCAQGFVGMFCTDCAVCATQAQVVQAGM